MCDIKTSKIKSVIAQINKCASLGADIMRVSVLDEKDAKAIKEIKKGISIPLVADIHFDYKLALLSIKNGADAIRINPGNIGSIEKIKFVVDACNEKNIPIRIGVNSGSMDKEIFNYDSKLTAQKMVDSIKKHVQILENLNFHNIVLSLKSSDVETTIKAYKLISDIYSYPLHIGVTEAGTKDISLIKTSLAFGVLLSEGIGDTIRVSMTSSPYEEIIAAKRILHELNLYPNYYSLISCPTCGRCMVDVEKIANQIEEYLEASNKKITVAVMGCVVNGPGEAKSADLGIAGGKNSFVLFKKGKIIKTIKEENAIEELKKEIDNF
jgi:(E)-4-hydroxy-3-methylbut-2-enyl-diphosphate synthase